jgi:hypothetical protein
MAAWLCRRTPSQLNAITKIALRCDTFILPYVARGQIHYSTERGSVRTWYDAWIKAIWTRLLRCFRGWTTCLWICG